jgi:hypothetical protein
MPHTSAHKSSAQKPGSRGPLQPTFTTVLQAANDQLVEATTVLDAAMVQATETTRVLESLIARFDQIARRPIPRQANIAADLQAAVETRAREEGRTIPQVMSQALEAYLQRPEAGKSDERQSRPGEVAMSGHPVTVERHGRWHQFLALAMFKLGVTDVTVFTQDIMNFAATYGPEATVIVDSVGDRMTLRLVNETQAGQLARKARRSPT